MAENNNTQKQNTSHGEINFLELGRKISEKNQSLNITAKDYMCPIILGCHDNGQSESDMTLLKTRCNNEGFSNAITIKAIPIPNDNSIPPSLTYSDKFNILIKLLGEKKIYAMPVFYIHPTINEGHGKGLICEYLDIINIHSYLREFCIVLRHPNADFIEQINLLHPSNVYDVTTIEEAADSLIGHLNGQLPFIRRIFFNG